MLVIMWQSQLFGELLVDITLLEINMQHTERAFKMFSSVSIEIPFRNPS